MWVRQVVLVLAVFGAHLVVAPPAALADGPLGEVTHGPRDSGLIALTFDAGGVAGPAARVLGALRERGIRATFFLSGQWVERYPELAAQVGADGHELANHSYSHPDLRGLSAERIAWELGYTESLIETIVGLPPVRLYRPPFGARDQRVLRVTEELGYRSVMWALDSGDWRTDATPGSVARRVLGLVQAGDIVVMHVASTATAVALPGILDGLSSRGLRVATVSEVLAGAEAVARPEAETGVDEWVPPPAIAD